MTDKPITGAQKVAAFLLHADRDRIAEILRHIDPKILPDIASAMTELNDDLTTPQGLHDLYRELAGRITRPRSIRSQDATELETMLASSIGDERAAQVLSTIQERRQDARPLAFLEERPPAMSVAVLSNEPRSVIALVLAHLDPSLSAEVLGSLHPDDALDVVNRIAHLQTPSNVVMRSVANALHEKVKISEQVPAPSDPARSLKTIAEVLNFSDPDTEQSVLEGIEKEDGEMANEIRDHMFTWDELGSVDSRSMQKILATVDTRTLAMSLKGCPPSVEENVFGNLSSRVKDMVADERELAGAVPMSDVLAARAEVLKGVRTLMESGEFRPARAGEELVS